MSIAAKIYALNQINLTPIIGNLNQVGAQAVLAKEQLTEVQQSGQATEDLLAKLKTVSVDELNASVNKAITELQQQRNLLTNKLNISSMPINQISRGGGSAASVIGDPAALQGQIQELDRKLLMLSEFTRQVAQNGDLAGLLTKLETEHNRSLS